MRPVPMIPTWDSVNWRAIAEAFIIASGAETELGEAPDRSATALVFLPTMSKPRRPFRVKFERRVPSVASCLKF